MGTRTRAARARSALRAGGVSFNLFVRLLLLVLVLPMLWLMLMLMLLLLLLLLLMLLLMLLLSLMLVLMFFFLSCFCLQLRRGTRTRAARARSALRDEGISFHAFGCLLLLSAGQRAEQQCKATVQSRMMQSKNA